MRSESLRVGSVVVLLLTAGCQGGLGGLMGGGGSLSFSAGAIHVPESAVSESPFSLASDKSVSFEHSFEVGGESREVKLNAHMVHLKRSYEGAPLGSLVILSVPQIKVLGQQIEVTEQVSPASLVGQARGSSAELQQRQKVGTRPVRILGQNRTVDVFSGTATREGESADARIYVTNFDHRGDTIVAVGIVPQVESSNGGSVLDLLEALQYEG